MSAIDDLAALLETTEGLEQYERLKASSFCFYFTLASLERIVASFLPVRFSSLMNVCA